MKWKQVAAAAVACVMLTGVFAPTNLSAAGDLTSKYRVYQNSKPLKEFANKNQAIAYAKYFNNSYVEQIGNRALVWEGFASYKVYQEGHSTPSWEFTRLEDAIALAQSMESTSIRKLSDGGWVWDNYPDHAGYTLYQGDKTLPNWTFETLEEAQAEAKKWANAHIIDNDTNRWVWDNIPEERKAELREGEETYRVYQGSKTLSGWGFDFLQDAVNEALKWANSTIVNTKKLTTVYENTFSYTVYQQGEKKSAHPSLNAALLAAAKLTDAAIEWNGQQIWSNEPYYEVHQTGKLVRTFNSPVEAISFAKYFENAEVVTLDGVRMWDNIKKLLYLGWNGSSNHNTIVSQVSNTQGLDIDSPTWFYLQDASGTLKDDSNKATMEWLKKQGLEVHPLVHNQFDAKLTSAFLADSAAQKKFIDALVSRLVALGADGVNIDFESVAAKDRDRFTAFVKGLSEAARAKGLTVSIDLLRGSVAWNHLTAYDHEKLHQYVDYVMIMAYDQFYSGSDSPGPVSGLGWAEQGVEEYLSYGIPRSKLVLGVPFYIRVWEVDASGKLLSNRAVWMKDIGKALEDAEVTSSEDSRYGLQKFEYKKDGKNYVFWLENIDTVKSRVEIAKKHDLAGIAVWRLGYEPAELWTELLRMK